MDFSTLRYFFLFIKIHFLVNILLVVELFRGILNLFIPTRHKKVQNRLALVTGGGNGIGRALAIKLAEKGANIAIADIDIIAAEKTVAFLIEKFQVKAKAFKVNVSDAKEVLKLKSDIESSMGFVDLLVNNAGVLSLNLSLREKTPEQVEEVIKINLMSHFWVGVKN
jgi:NAD(P)-dependent dehydrogenase (short-subunit alcohol dehydrogenase family)